MTLTTQRLINITIVVVAVVIGQMGSDASKLAPQALSDLTENTSFTEDEIRRWYKEFQRDFPGGELSIDQFKDVYVQHFPDGDATKFAEHVFRTFDKDDDHRLNFREFLTALSVTARGDSVDRLRWAFQMYDIDDNGYISKAECTEIIQVGNWLSKVSIKSPA